MTQLKHVEWYQDEGCTRNKGQHYKNVSNLKDLILKPVQE